MRTSFIHEDASAGVTLSGGILNVRLYAMSSMTLRQRYHVPQLAGIEKAAQESDGRWRLLLREGVTPRDLLGQLVGQGAPIDSFERILAPMEDVFIRVVQKEAQ